MAGAPVARTALPPEQNTLCALLNRAVTGEAMATERPIVLVIEDEDAILAVVEGALEEGGFQTATAKTGEEAVTLLNGGRPYRALVTDVNLLGRLDGWEIARAAREIDPHFPVVYMTGGAADKWPVLGVPNSILLQKPFAPAQVVAAVSQLLNAGSQQAGPA
jgi:DNA-binding response OmpR family regulator